VCDFYNGKMKRAAGLKTQLESDCDGEHQLGKGREAGQRPEENSLQEAHGTHGREDEEHHIAQVGDQVESKTVSMKQMPSQCRNRATLVRALLTFTVSSFSMYFLMPNTQDSAKGSQTQQRQGKSHIFIRQEQEKEYEPKEY
jgi:hypothetical protein